jgi:hypothetical protein
LLFLLFLLFLGINPRSRCAPGKSALGITLGREAQLIGQAIHLEDTASKGRSGRVIPMNEELRTALREYAETVWMPTSTFLIQSERSRGMSPQAVVNLFWRWYRRRLRWLFEPLWSPHFHNQRGA